ncbi:MAG: hypothetical protein M1819_004983 [Sarea resinae]|nr:MAG: hypothetical protein M1819_004983 [Sarea resinae]
MQNRIDRLESLVLSLMTNGSQSAGPAAAAAALSGESAGTGSPGHSHELDDDDVIKEEQNGEESETDQVARSFGVMKVGPKGSSYYGDAHWATILSDIAEVKSYFANHSAQLMEQSDKIEASHQEEQHGIGCSSSFLFGAAKPPELSEIMTSMPAKATVDKLITRYFNSHDPSIHILHGPTFQKEDATDNSQYERYWAAPKQTSPIWLGLLFAIMCLAVHSCYRDDDEIPEFRGRSLDMADFYRLRTIQCLAHGNCSRPPNYMVEALLIYLQGEYARRRDSEVDVWILTGIIARVAMRMGYHRDSAPFSSISTFQGEMRRRVWCLLRQLDLLFSFQVALPSMIRARDSDTNMPSNLYDYEFGEDTKVLPPSRPDTEPTEVAYIRAKGRLTFAFGQIDEQAHMLGSSSYEDTIKLDRAMRDAYAAVPPHLRLRRMDEMLMEPPPVIMQRFNLDLLYNKAQCVLHRKFLARARENPRYAHSRRTCVDSSMELLKHQAVLHYESGPNGRLRTAKWFVSSLTTHDFLLAAMIVCLDLYYGAEAQSAGRESGDLYTWGSERRAEMIQALETSKEIWESLKDQAMEAYKASALLNLMLEKLRRHRCGQQSAQYSSMSSGTNSGGLSGAVSPFPQDDSKPEHSAAMTLGMLSTGGFTPNSAAMFDRAFAPSPSQGMNMALAPSGLSPEVQMDSAGSGSTTGASPYSLFGPNLGMMDLPPSNLDWDAWDSYIQGANLDLTSQAWPGNGLDLPLPPIASTIAPTASAEMSGGPAVPPQPSLQSPLLQQHHHPQSDQQHPSQQHQQPPGPYSLGDGVFMGVTTPPGS